MAVGSEFQDEKQRLEATILRAVNTSADPAAAARQLLSGAFPSASFVEKGDGILDAQGLDAAQRQSLEDALFEVNLSLVNEAVARGLPLMQYLHPDAAHDGITTIPRFLQVCLELARPQLAEPLKETERAAGGRRRLIDYECWARLFESLMEVGTIADCADLFRLMEGSGGGGSAQAGGGGGAGAGAAEAEAGGGAAEADLGWAAVFCSEAFRRELSARLSLLRMSNMLFRRLSKAYDVRLCGRLLIFISRCYELTDKSGVNMPGALNAGLALPIDEVEPGAVDSIGEQVDRRLYTSFWGLQAVFQNPAQALQPAVYGKVVSDMQAVLAEFGAIRNPVAASAPWVGQRGAAGQQQHQVAAADGRADAMDVDGQAAGGGGEGGGVGARYLTSSKLFGLQLRDCTFRRHFLVQCLALLQYIEQPSKADKSALGQRPDGLEALRDKLYAALADTKDNGPEFAAAVRSVLSHEAHWVAWKHGTQPPGVSGVAGAAGGGPASPGSLAAAAGGTAAAELCRDFTRPAAPSTKEILAAYGADAPAAGAGPVKRKRSGRAAPGGGGGAGRYAVARAVAALADPLAGLRASERRTRSRNLMGEEVLAPTLPTAEEVTAPVLEDLDPDNDVEAPYRRVREPVVAWKVGRTLVRHCLEHYKRGDDLEDSVLDMQPEMRAKIAAAKAAREAELAAAAASEAAEGGGKGGDAKMEEGEARAGEGDG